MQKTFFVLTYFTVLSPFTLDHFKDSVATLGPVSLILGVFIQNK